MDIDENIFLAVDEALKATNTALFCSYEGHPISFHAVVNESEKALLTAVKRTVSAFGGSYVSKYENMTPYTLLLVSDLGFRKKRFNRPAVSITYVGDCVHSNTLLDVNDYLHPWDNQERWKSVNLFDVAYYRHRKFQCSLDFDSISNVTTFLDDASVIADVHSLSPVCSERNPSGLESIFGSETRSSQRIQVNANDYDGILEETSRLDLPNTVKGCNINERKQFVKQSNLERKLIGKASTKTSSSRVVDNSSDLLEKNSLPEKSDRVEGPNNAIKRKQRVELSPLEPESITDASRNPGSSRVVDNSSANDGLLEQTSCPEISNKVKLPDNCGRENRVKRCHPESESIAEASVEPNPSRVVNSSSGNNRILKKTARSEISNRVKGNRSVPESSAKGFSELSSSKVVDNSSANSGLLEKSSSQEVSNKVKGSNISGRKLCDQRSHPEQKSITKASTKSSSSRVAKKSSGNDRILKKTLHPEISNKAKGNRSVPESSAKGFSELGSSKVVDNSNANSGLLKTSSSQELSNKVKGSNISGRKLCDQRSHPERKTSTKSSSSGVVNKFSGNDKLLKKTLHPEISNRVEESLMNGKVPVVVLRKCPNVSRLNLSKTQLSGNIFWEVSSTERTRPKEQKCDTVSSKSQFPQKGNSKSNKVPSDLQNPSLKSVVLPMSQPKVVSKALKDGSTSQMKTCNTASTSSPSPRASLDMKWLSKDGKTLEKSGGEKMSKGTKRGLSEDSSSDVEMVVQKVPVVNIKDEPTDSDDEDFEMPVKMRGRGYQDRFKTSEKVAILEWLVERNKFRNLRGVKVWRQMEKMKICPNRTWQSLKNHFLKKLILQLDDFAFLMPEQKDKFRNPNLVESSDDEEGDSTMAYPHIPSAFGSKKKS